MIDACISIEGIVQKLSVYNPSLERIVEYLNGGDSKVGRFYFLPKIHKGLNGVIGRPIISNCASFTEHILEHLDHYLNPLTQHGESYIKDTNHFVLKLGEIWSIPEGALLCTMDVVGLYPSIPNYPNTTCSSPNTACS